MPNSFSKVVVDLFEFDWKYPSLIHTNWGAEVKIRLAVSTFKAARNSISKQCMLNKNKQIILKADIM